MWRPILPSKLPVNKRIFSVSVKTVYNNYIPVKIHILYEGS